LNGGTADLGRAVRAKGYGLAQAKQTLELWETAGPSVETLIAFLQAGAPPELVRQQLLKKIRRRLAEARPSSTTLAL
jgi:hypothetical protein